MLNGIEDSLRWVEKNLWSNGGVIIDRGLLHNNQHGFITACHESKVKSYYIVYKTELFRNFGMLFGKGDTPGESLNIEAYQTICDKPYDMVVFAHPRTVYAIETEKLKEYIRVNRTIREQHNKNEWTVSIDIKEFTILMDERDINDEYNKPTKTVMKAQTDIRTW